MDMVIETANVTRKFGNFTAVDSISLSVRKGEIYGFLGLNGAGKTTTIRMLLGMVRATSGTCCLNGMRVQAGSSALWSRVGYLVEIPYSYPDLTVRENLEIIRRLRSIPDRSVVDSVMQRLDIGAYQDRKARHLSLGNAQRLGLAKALMHNPDILLLDEPANGLDPAGIVEIRELLLSLAHDHGVTVFVSSHILGEVSRFATRVGIIHDGRLIQELDFDALEKLRLKRLLIDTGDNPAARAVLEGRGVATSLAESGLVVVTDPGSIAHPEAICVALVNAGCPPSMLRVEEEDLETYFLRAIGKN